MFDIGASELLVIVIVAVLVIGPKDLPLALRTAGRWIGKVRRVSAQFRTGFDAMVREAEMEDMEKKWKDQNAKIMADNPSDTIASDAENGESDDAGPEMKPLNAPEAGEKPEPAGKPEPEIEKPAKSTAKKPAAKNDEPLLPLGKPKAG